MLKKQKVGEISSLKRVVSIAALSSLALSGCMESHPKASNHIEQSTSVGQQIESSINNKNLISYFDGDLVLVNDQGESQVLIRPIVSSNSGHKTGNLLKDFNFYTINAENVDSTTNFSINKVNTDNYAIEVLPDSNESSIKGVVLRPSHLQLLNSPTLFNLSSVPQQNLLGFDIASFNYQTVGETYFTPSNDPNEPVGVLLQGQSINHQ